MERMSPIKTFIMLALVIGAVEQGLMFVLTSGIIELHPSITALVDSFFLVLILFPFLYFFGYQPFIKNTEKLSMEKRKVEETHDLFLSVLDGIDAVVYLADMQTYELLFTNKYTREVFGNITGKVCWQTLQRGQTGPCLFCTNDKLINSAGEPQTYRWEFRNTRNGRWYDIRDRAIRWIDGRLVRMEIAIDITSRKETEDYVKQQNFFLQNMLESMPYPFYVVNADSFQVELSNTIAQFQGIRIGEKCYTATDNANIPCHEDEDKCLLNLVKKKRKPIIIEHISKDPNGNDRYLEIHGYPIIDESGKVTRMIKYQIDITERKKAEETLLKISVTDEMTGIYNRRGFLTLAEKQIKIAHRMKGELFVLYADCDKLKWINDNLGHKYGDQLIIETAEVMKATFRQSDIIGRLGGDEFAVLMIDELGSESIDTVKKRMADAIRKRNELPGRGYVLSVSYGIVRYDKTNPCSMEQLLSKADYYMYKFKKNQEEFPPGK